MAITKRLKTEIENDEYIKINFETKKIKAKGKPAEVFAADPLSILRLIRYSILVRPMCTIEPDTFYSIQNHRYQLLKIDADKILEEINKILVMDKMAYRLAWHLESLRIKDVLKEKKIKLIAIGEEQK